MLPPESGACFTIGRLIPAHYLSMKRFGSTWKIFEILKIDTARKRKFTLPLFSFTECGVTSRAALVNLCSQDLNTAHCLI